MRTNQVAAISPLEVLFERAPGEEIPLTPALSRAYGRLAFPLTPKTPHVVANFVETLDGVVSLGIPGKSGGGPISGGNQHDRLVMGLLRAVADALVVGAGTLRSVPKHIWTPDYIFPDLAEEFRELRTGLGKTRYPLNVIVTASGDLDGDFAVLEQRDVPVHVLTTETGARRIRQSRSNVEANVLAEDGPIAAKDIVGWLGQTGSRVAVSEAGPELTGTLLAERALDELFLTLAPQVAGRDGAAKRPGLVSGRLFAPDDPRRAELLSVRRGGDYLFLRYAATSTDPATPQAGRQPD
jgi:riboflavin biosynthesis pyrimidine reductase